MQMTQAGTLPKPAERVDLDQYEDDALAKASPVTSGVGSVSIMRRRCKSLMLSRLLGRRSMMGLDRTSRLGLLAVVLALNAVSTPATAQPQKPNVVFILADNVGYGDLGSYGGGELRGAPT